MDTFDCLEQSSGLSYEHATTNEKNWKMLKTIWMNNFNLTFGIRLLQTGIMQKRKASIENGIPDKKSIDRSMEFAIKLLSTMMRALK